MYTITHSCDLENQKVYEIKIVPPEENAVIFETAKLVCYHRYHIEYRRFEHEVVCPEYMTEDGTCVVVIPWFLIPGRPYPIQVYLYASDLYSAKPNIGQRAVSEATRVKFNLKTFSHTTVGRSFKALEQSRQKALESRFGEEMKTCGDENPSPDSVTKDIASEVQKTTKETRRFPSALDTAMRRKAMSEFLQAFRGATKKSGLEVAARLFVKYWYSKTKRLLL